MRPQRRPARAAARPRTGCRRSSGRRRSRSPSRPARGRPGRPAAGRAWPRAGWRRARSAAAAGCPARRASSRCRRSRAAARARRAPRCAATSRRRARRRRWAPARARATGPATIWATIAMSSPAAEREPRRLYAFGDRRRPVTGTEPAGGPAGGAVGEHVAEPGRERQHAAADGEAGERRAAQVPDDGGVDQHVERLGGEHDQRRQRQRGDLPELGCARGSARRSRSGSRRRCCHRIGASVRPGLASDPSFIGNATTPTAPTGRPSPTRSMRSRHTARHRRLSGQRRATRPAGRA